jgi:hypothetical protein
LVGVLMAGRERDAQALTFALNDFVGKARVGIGAFEDSGDAEILCGLQGFESAERPCVDDIYFAGEPAKAGGNDAVVKSESAIAAKETIGEAELSTSEGGRDMNLRRHGAIQSAGVNEEFGAGSGEAIDLLPSGVTDAGCTQLVGKAVQDPNAGVRRRFHCA